MTRVDDFRRKCRMVGGVRVAEASGVPVSLTNARGMKSLTVTGNSIQDGVPAPDAPIAIKNCGTAVTGGYAHTIRVGGKNLFDVSLVPTVGKKIINNGDGTISVNAYAANTSRTLSQLLPGVREGQEVTFSMKTTAEETYNMMFVRDDAIWKSGTSKVITSVMLAGNVTLYCGKEDGVDHPATLSNIQFEVGSAATTYEPCFEPQLFTRTLSAPLRLGDTWDVTTGLVTRKRVVRDLDGTASGCRQYPGQTTTSFLINFNGYATPALGYFMSLCTHFVNTGNNVPFSSEAVAGTFTDHVSLANKYFAWGGVGGVFTDFTAWLDAQYAAGTPVTVEYQLATPTIEQVEPLALPVFSGTTVYSLDGVPASAMLAEYYTKG